MTNAAMQQLYDLSFAIFSSDYVKVQEFLADESFPVNLYFPRFKKLPRDLAIETQDPKMIQLFLNCPRVNWLQLNELNFEDFDRSCICYDLAMKAEWKKKSKSDAFKCLDPWFEQICPEEARLIYDKMFEALEGESEEDLEGLVFKAFQSKYAFNKALHFCKDINKKTENGCTVLHLICQSHLNLLEQAKFVISRGAQVNATDDDGCTPLMLSMNNLKGDICLALVENGADLFAADSIGRVAFDYVPPESAQFYLDSFEFPEKLFRNYLQKQACSVDLKAIFIKYPQYKEIYDSDLRIQLLKVKYLDQSDLRRSEAKTFLIDLIKRGDQFPGFDEDLLLHHVLSESADEFLHLAVENNSPILHALLTKFKANPNSLHEGLPPLFKATHSDTILALLKAGADAWLTLDGCYFFQREGFSFSGKSADWLVFMYDGNSALFEASPRTGKTVFQCATDRLDFPNATNVIGDKITWLLFKQLHDKDLETEYFEDIVDYDVVDEQGNSIQHYHVLEYLKLRVRPSAQEMNSLKNKDGLTALDLFVSSNSFLEKLCTFVGLQHIEDWKTLEAVYDKAFGAGAFDTQVLKVIGGRLLSSAGCLTLEALKYLLKVKNLPVEHFILQLYGTKCKARLAWNNYDIAGLLLDAGASGLDIFYLCSSGPFSLFCSKIFKERSGIEAIFFEFMQNYEFFSRRNRNEFLKQPEIVRLLKQNKHLLHKLLPYFFSLCGHADQVEALLELGLNPKELVDSRILCDDLNDWCTKEMWRLLRDRAGLQLEDLQRIKFVFDPKNGPLASSDGISYTFMEKLSLEEDCQYSFECVYN